ncbi:MAG: tripartite tricarboxylate transporter substrate binding protein [Burkholderiales bacterium]
MKHFSRLLICVSAAFACIFSMHAMAQTTFPTRPLRLIAPFPAGGSSDGLARLIAPELSKKLGQPVIVENKPGAGGNIGLDAIAKAEPDGYTFGLASPGPTVVSITLMDSLPYDPIKDLTPIGLIADLPILLVINSAVPVSSVAELIAAEKSNPGRYFFASAGNGTTMHLSGELFNVMAGTKLQHVAYKGTAPAIADLLAGQIQVGFLDMSSVGTHLSGNRIKVLAVGSKKRISSLPNIPTVSEAGVPGYQLSGWFGIVAPARVPGPIVTKLNQALVEIVAMPHVQEKMIAIGLEPISSTPEQFGQFIKDEIPRWAKLLQISGVKATP